jgi:transposase
MPKAYSDDLRRKLLEAHDAGEGTLEDLAERFRVSVGWAYKISAARTRTGEVERQPGAKRGRVSKVTAEIESLLKGAVQARADTTLAELQVRLWEERQLPVSITWLWTVLDRLGLRYKKNTARRRTGPAADQGTPGALAVGDR